MPSLKKTEIRIRHDTVEDLPFEPGTELTEPQKKVVQEYCYQDVRATHAIYQDHSRQHIRLRHLLASKFKLNKQKLTSLSEPKTAEYILSNVACRESGNSPYRIRKDLDHEPVTEVHLSSCIPDWIQFSTPKLKNFLMEVKTLTLPVANNGYVKAKEFKHVVTIGAKNYQIGIGGLHSVDKPYQWSKTNDKEMLIDADVTSYYPSILLRDGLYPRGYGRTWINTYRYIYDERLKAKTARSTEEAHALKIVLNATFGKLGSQFSTFYDPRLLLRVTLTGQFALLMLIEKYHKAGIEVISANTDGIIAKMNEDQQPKAWLANTEWQKETKFMLEYTHYVKYARRDVNNYTALTTDNKTKNKGIFTPPDLKHDVQAPIIQDMARAYLLYGTEVDDYLDEERYLCVFDFLFSFSAVKGWQMSLKTPTTEDTVQGQILQKSNRWYVSSKPLNNKLIKTGGKRGGSISVPNGSNIVIMNKVTDQKVPHDINYSYYIAAANKLIVSCGG